MRLAIADLRLAAWLAWMTPLLAALSSARLASRMSVAAVVKAHDVVAGVLRTPGTPTAPVQSDRRRRDDGED